MTSDVEHTQEQPAEEEHPRRRKRLVIAVLLLLLLLLCCLGAASTALMRGGSQSISFVVSNIECLQCHTEMLDTMGMSSIHDPYARQQCESCHNNHAWLVTSEVTEEGGTVEVTSSVWLRWGPFRWVFDTLDQVLRVTGAASDLTTSEEIIGEATLVADIETLCWTCHGGLRPEREKDFPHSPFATNNCVSCHVPHASNNSPLLITTSKSLCLTCHPIGRELNRAQAHDPVANFDCMECHEAHASDHPGILVANQRDLCFTCHPSVAMLSNDAVQHQPFGEGAYCTGCHEPHGADVMPLLKAETPRLCYDCHESIEPRFARESHHPIGERLDCPSCHQPHASEHRGLLVEQERTLCLGCHGELIEARMQAVQHEPFEDDPCTSCHVPHGSKYEPLLRNPEPNLCYRCHLDIATEMSRPSHHPKQCSNCHEVHAGDYEKLLVGKSGNGFCYGCHGEIALTYLQSSHKGIDCRGCHQPHGSRWGSLRTEHPAVQCSNCHPEEEGVRFVGNGDTAHRASPEFYDAVAGKPLTCTSTCHNAHGTPFELMLRIMERPFDGNCLPCHDKVGKTY